MSRHGAYNSPHCGAALESSIIDGREFFELDGSEK